ncbi:hypothetical protein CAEBREN_21491 [Caenorhabditis brenneri]|uniref:Uncharacterized protein n=1 Tax=Caenorhabditis brenneri TaxID=135651 RepID=G0N4W6_CAEBE|nr:hypothetical protein CAEBREN_21491 [Caenorhabditis brenneri]
MDWIYSWKDSIFYGICSCSGTQAYHEKEVPHHHDRLDMPLQLKAYRGTYMQKRVCVEFDSDSCDIEGVNILAEREKSEWIFI